MYDIVLTLDLARKLHTDGVVSASLSVKQVFIKDIQISPNKCIVWDLKDNWLYYMHKDYEYMIDVTEHLINELVVIADAQARITYFNILLNSGETCEAM